MINRFGMIQDLIDIGLILLFVVMIILIFKNLNKIPLSKRKGKITWLIIFFVCAGISFYFLQGVDDYLPPNPYRYEIFDNEIFGFGDFDIYHDFSRDIGNITFRLKNENISSESEIEFDFPRSIKDVEIIAWGEFTEPFKINETNLRREEDYDDYVGGNFSRIRFELVETTKDVRDKDTYYSISYKMEMLPSGHFSLNMANKGYLYGRTPKFSFDLGKKFRCTGLCIDRPHFVKPIYLNTNKEIRLEMEKEGSGEFYSFILLAVRNIDLSFGFWLSSTVSLLILFLTTLKELIEGKNLSTQP